MISINDKRECCGCGACIQKCPKQCITMCEDNEGFLYPTINIEECINCGLCEKVCPFKKITKNIINPIYTFAVKNKNDQERFNSSSGGVFIELAKAVIKKGGVVFGAIFDDNWEVKHSYAEELKSVYPMMGSKYLQSRTEKTYSEAEKFLKEERIVLFSGSPCQIAGLHNYLRKDYSNLITVDFLCHGVPSPKVWRKYIQAISIDINKDLNQKEPSKISLQSINFRSKYTGWKKYSIDIEFSKVYSSGKKQTLKYSQIHVNDPFMKVFLSDIILRPSCYRCKCKNGISHSDLTIADYWGIDKIRPEFDDDIGVGLVLINTEQGKEYFDSLPMEVQESSLNTARSFNGGFKETLKVHSKREVFFKKLDLYNNVIDLMDSCTMPSKKETLFLFLKRIYYKLIKL